MLVHHRRERREHSIALLRERRFLNAEERCEEREVILADEHRLEPAFRDREARDALAERASLAQTVDVGAAVQRRERGVVVANPCGVERYPERLRRAHERAVDIAEARAVEPRVRHEAREPSGAREALEHGPRAQDCLFERRPLSLRSCALSTRFRFRGCSVGLDGAEGGAGGGDELGERGDSRASDAPARLAERTPRERRRVRAARAEG
mmetsp:Transcript_1253/g.4661  ORF Transcript_1253/g.4661 Transcript_1253/m.4661 type:complete len:210 (-) Transcript_1253:64-693(-)